MVVLKTKRLLRFGNLQSNRLYFRLQANNATTSTESLSMWQSPEAFIELSNDGKHIRLGFTSNGLDDVTTTTYDEWDADRKIQGTSIGIPSKRPH